MLVSPADKKAMGPKDVYDAGQVAIISGSALGVSDSEHDITE